MNSIPPQCQTKKKPKKIWHKNTIQIVGFVIFNFCTFIYSLFQYFQMIIVVSQIQDITRIATSKSDSASLRILLMLIPIVISVFQLIVLFLSWRLYVEFGWKIYKKIGADPNMRCKLILLFSLSNPLFPFLINRN